jgi:hypothetical protein
MAKVGSPAGACRVREAARTCPLSIGPRLLRTLPSFPRRCCRTCANLHPLRVIHDNDMGRAPRIAGRCATGVSRTHASAVRCDLGGVANGAAAAFEPQTGEDAVGISAIHYQIEG